MVESLKEASTGAQVKEHKFFVFHPCWRMAESISTNGVRGHEVKRGLLFPRRHLSLFIQCAFILIISPSRVSFEQHLQDLFDVIMALNNQTVDLLRFQLFIHHRAFRKLGWRVHEFSTHWGKSPFDILSENPDAELKRKKIEFKYRDLEFHNLIQSYVSAEPDMHSTAGSRAGPVYSICVANAPRWIRALKQLWLRLQSCLLTETFEDGRITEFLVKSESPSHHVVNDIVTIIFVLEALSPVFKHIVSSRRAADALAKAG